MLNIVWPIFLILSVFYAILSGNLNTLNQSIFESTNTAIQLSITLLGTMCLWSGIMRIKKGDRIYQEISMNMVANILGLGNAATPLRN